jgi:DNA-binding CsgD family transcriptional regulator
MARRGIGIPVRALNDAVTLLHVLPLRRGTIRPGLVQRAVAAVFVVPQEQATYSAVGAMAQFYELTPAEGQVFASLAQGTSLARTAEALSVASATVRTHLHRIFEKTGCKRQAELVALAARHAITVP